MMAADGLRSSAETAGDLFFDFACLGDARADEDIKTLEQVFSLYDLHGWNRRQGRSIRTRACP